MSFYSSIVIFYPGRLPLIRLGDFRRVCDTLRNAFSLENDLFTVDICYQGASNSTPDVSWDETGTIGITEQSSEGDMPSDHTKQSLIWQQVWPDKSSDSQIITRADVSLGNLSDSSIAELARSNPESLTPSYISLTEMSISIGTVELGTLTGELPENECYGCISLSLSGYGYFTWQPLAVYWKTVRYGPTIQKALQLCRETFPVPSPLDLSVLKERLGDMFLNQEEYRPGDWIVSVSEFG